MKDIRLEITLKALCSSETLALSYQLKHVITLEDEDDDDDDDDDN